MTKLKYYPGKIRRLIERVIFRIFRIEHDWEIAWCYKEDFRRVYPSDMKVKLSEFNYRDRHYIIYIKK